MLLLPLLSHHQRHAAFLTCVSLMPVLLDAASLLQANPDGRRHHRPPTSADDPDADAVPEVAMSRRAAAATDDAPFWLSDDSVQPWPVGGKAGHSHHRGRGHHHQHHQGGRTHHRQHRAHGDHQLDVPASSSSLSSSSLQYPLTKPDRQVQTQTFQFDDPSPFGDPNTQQQEQQQQQHHHKNQNRQRNQDQDQEAALFEGRRQRDRLYNDNVDDDYTGRLIPANAELQERDNHKNAFKVPFMNTDYQSDGTGQEQAREEEEDDYEQEEDAEDSDADDDDTVNQEGRRGESRLHGRLTPCPGCQRITDEEVVVEERSGVARPTGHRLSEAQMKNMLIERIKQQILLKLRLPAAPNATRRHTRLPEPLARGDPMLGDQAQGHGDPPADDPDDFYGKTTQVVTFATNVPHCPPGRSTACFHFDLTGKVDASDVKTAELWVYKEPDSGDARPQTLVFSKLAGQHQNASKVGKELGHKVIGETQGWIRFDLKRLVSRWLINPERNLGLAVRCKTCQDSDEAPVATEGDRMPFVIIHTASNHQLYRRSTNDCGERSGNRCCRERFYVDFAQIGWDWVTWPRGYWANYCKGTCFVSSPILPKYQHTNIMQKVAVMNNNEELSPCCAPRKMSPLSLLYTLDGDFIRKHLPNMAVESCGCT